MPLHRRAALPGALLLTQAFASALSPLQEQLVEVLRTIEPRMQQEDEAARRTGRTAGVAGFEAEVHRLLSAAGDLEVVYKGGSRHGMGFV